MARVGSLCGHAPVEDSPYEDKCEFYEQLERDLSPAVGKQISIVLGLDAHGAVGSVESESVGAVNASNESLNGMMLRSMCQAYNLKLVNKFMDGAPTWASSAGCGRRIDFIAVSWSHFEAVTGCWVDRSIDIAPSGRDDHWVLAVRLDLTVAKDLVVNSSCGGSGVNPVFSPVSLQRIDPISLRDPAACGAAWISEFSLSQMLQVESCGDPYQVTEMWKRARGLSRLRCNVSDRKFGPRKRGTHGFLSSVFRRCGG